MMDTLQVHIYDDQQHIASELASKIQRITNGTDVSARSSGDLAELLRLLHDRRTKRRAQPEHVYDREEIDGVNVIVVDYDLLDYSDMGDTTGRRLAYFLRCFTLCGSIVVLNEFGENTFDLSLTSADPKVALADFADLHVGSQQIGNVGLWQSSLEGYRPWYWPILPNMTEKFEMCVADVQENMDVSILSFFNLDNKIDWLSPEAQNALTATKGVESTTFRHFSETVHGGIAKKDKLLPRQMARVVASRIRSLLNSVVMPSQNLLVDAPHLVARFPSLFKGELREISQWDALCKPNGDGVEGLLSDRLHGHRFDRDHWLWRPAWYWPDINKDEQIEEVSNPWSMKTSDVVFCENLSRCMPSKAVEEFRANVSPPFNRRFVMHREKRVAATYLDKAGKGGPLDPTDAVYVPEAAFAV